MFIALFGVFIRYNYVAMGNFPEYRIIYGPGEPTNFSFSTTTGQPGATNVTEVTPSTTTPNPLTRNSTVNAIYGMVPRTIIQEYNVIQDQAHAQQSRNHIPDHYAIYQDIHVMMFIGFGFIMTFLHRYGFGGVAFNFLLGAYCIQWATITHGFIRELGWYTDKSTHNYIFYVDITTLIKSDYAIASALVSFGAVLGKVSPLQLVIMGLIEMVAYNVNCLFVYDFLKAADCGHSLTVHTFGAYFGLAISAVLYKSHVAKESHKESSVYHSDIFSMIGTLFLWTLYPSFNAAGAVDEGRIRAIVNTYFALCSSCCMAFAITALLNKEKFNMMHIQNATIAGGVAVGTIADMIIQPWGALLTGFVAGSISTLGYYFLTPLLNRLRVHDTCGVHNHHGLPGFISGLGSIIAAGVATDWRYGDSSAKIFTDLSRPRNVLAGIQAAALFTSMFMGIVCGIITGIILVIPIWDQPRGSENFDDQDNWTNVDDIPDEKILRGNFHPSKAGIAQTAA